MTDDWDTVNLCVLQVFLWFHNKELVLTLSILVVVILIQVGCSTMRYYEHCVQDYFVTLTKCGGRVFHSMMVRARIIIHIEVHIIINNTIVIQHDMQLYTM